ncbi:hypothetical protein GCM10023321_70130 [Pseudonocardia eucalypti]|uniref:Uncharacterized protein n=1 Tax=Pseudonocardia eucalypti TaxID=648755 RepID=A0ABP9R433_9PSEU
MPINATRAHRGERPAAFIRENVPRAANIAIPAPGGSGNATPTAHPRVTSTNPTTAVTKVGARAWIGDHNARSSASTDRPAAIAPATAGPTPEPNTSSPAAAPAPTPAVTSSPPNHRDDGTAAQSVDTFRNPAKKPLTCHQNRAPKAPAITPSSVPPTTRNQPPGTWPPEPCPDSCPARSPNDPVADGLALGAGVCVSLSFGFFVWPGFGVCVWPGFGVFVSPGFGVLVSPGFWVLVGSPGPGTRTVP